MPLQISALSVRKPCSRRQQGKRNRAVRRRSMRTAQSLKKSLTACISFWSSRCKSLKRIRQRTRQKQKKRRRVKWSSLWSCFIIPCWKMKSMKNMPTRSLMKLKNPTSRTCRLTMHFPISTRKWSWNSGSRQALLRRPRDRRCYFLSDLPALERQQPLPK